MSCNCRPTNLFSFFGFNWPPEYDRDATRMRAADCHKWLTRFAKVFAYCVTVLLPLAAMFGFFLLVGHK